MANYSSDAEMKKVDSDISQWLGSRENFSEVRDVVTKRINGAIMAAGQWSVLDALGVLTSGADMVDKEKILNGADLEDVENTWVREILYYDNLAAAGRDDPLFERARGLRLDRMRMLAHLALYVDLDGDGSAEEIIHIGKIRRG